MRTFYISVVGNGVQVQLRKVITRVTESRSGRLTRTRERKHRTCYFADATYGGSRRRAVLAAMAWRDRMGPKFFGKREWLRRVAKLLVAKRTTTRAANLAAQRSRTPRRSRPAVRRR